jgi:hypothetical protein
MPDFSEAEKALGISIPSVAKIAEALAKAQAEIVQPEKNKTVTVKSDKGSYTFDYADYNAIVEAVRGPLSKQSICFTHLIEMRDRELILVTRLIHSSGEFLESLYPLPRSSNAKEIGGAVTYGKRYCLSAITGCVADDDADAEPENTTSLKDKKPAAIAPRAQGPAPQQQQSSPARDQQNQNVRGPSSAQVTRLWTIAKASSWTNEQVHLYLEARWKLQSVTTLERVQYDELCDLMPKKPYEQAIVSLTWGKDGKS